MEMLCYLEMLDELQSYDHPFTLEDAVRLFGLNFSQKGLFLRELRRDDRFLVLDKTGDQLFFVPKKTILRLLCYLNFRLARARVSTLLAKQIVNFLRAFSPGLVPDYLDERILLEFGRRLGLIAPTIDPEGYTFPLAHLLSCAFSGFNNTNRKSSRRRTPSEEKNRLPIDVDILEQVAVCVMSGEIGEEFLSLESLEGRFKGARAFEIALQRMSILSSKRSTLQELGEKFGITRERVRQLELRFWIQIAESRELVSELFRRFIAYFMRNNSLVIDASNADFVVFLCKALKIPVATLSPDLHILGAEQCHIQQLLNMPRYMDVVLDPAKISGYLVQKGLGYLPLDDLVRVSNALSFSLQRRFGKDERVYLALRSLGRPAHYTEVRKRCEELFPWDTYTDRNVHAILGRETMGIVWVGRRGMYALQEWGYQRPEVSIYELIEAIVRRKYEETGKPVPRDIIVAEVLKSRPLSLSSLNIAFSFCRGIKKVGKEFYVPRELGSFCDHDPERDYIDSVIREFE
jgi:hypothetical protein